MNTSKKPKFINIEALKDKRASLCDGCDFNVEDDIEKIEDQDQRISGKICELCFCPLPFLLIQIDKKCDLNKW